jgi:hypothetical protein
MAISRPMRERARLMIANAEEAVCIAVLACCIRCCSEESSGVGGVGVAGWTMGDGVFSCSMRIIQIRYFPQEPLHHPLILRRPWCL